jgi:hypothetical protein
MVGDPPSSRPCLRGPRHRCIEPSSEVVNRMTCKAGAGGPPIDGHRRPSHVDTGCSETHPIRIVVSDVNGFTFFLLRNASSRLAGGLPGDSGLLLVVCFDYVIVTLELTWRVWRKAAKPHTDFLG